MFNNNLLTKKFFDIVDDSRNLSYKKYDEQYGVIYNMYLPYARDEKDKELFMDGVEKEDFDLLYKLGNLIYKGDFEKIKNFLNENGQQADVAFITRCFTLADYKSRGNALLASERLSAFVNVAGLSDTENMAKFMVKDHRTLQQNKMRLFVQFCQEMAKLDNYKDARNEASVKLAQAVLRVMEEEDIFLPYI